MALNWGSHRPRRYVLFRLMLEILRFHPEAQIRSWILWAVFRPLTSSMVGFHNFNLRIFNLRVSNPNKLIVDVFLTRCRISMCQGLGPTKTRWNFGKSTVAAAAALIVARASGRRPSTGRGTKTTRKARVDICWGARRYPRGGLSLQCSLPKRNRAKSTQQSWPLGANKQQQIKPSA